MRTLPARIGAYVCGFGAVTAFWWIAVSAFDEYYADECAGVPDVGVLSVFSVPGYFGAHAAQVGLWNPYVFILWALALAVHCGVGFVTGVALSRTWPVCLLALLWLGVRSASLDLGLLKSSFEVPFPRIAWIDTWPLLLPCVVLWVVGLCGAMAIRRMMYARTRVEIDCRSANAVER